MREWRNWQTRTFEGRVDYPYGFKSRFSHQKEPHFLRFFFLLPAEYEQAGNVLQKTNNTILFDNYIF